jgi:hypothetical protein
MLAAISKTRFRPSSMESGIPRLAGNLTQVLRQEPESSILRFSHWS